MRGEADVLRAPAVAAVRRRIADGPQAEIGGGVAAAQAAAVVYDHPQLRAQPVNCAEVRAFCSARARPCEVWYLGVHDVPQELRRRGRAARALWRHGHGEATHCQRGRRRRCRRVCRRGCAAAVQQQHCEQQQQPHTAAVAQKSAAGAGPAGPCPLQMQEAGPLQGAQQAGEE